VLVYHTRESELSNRGTQAEEEIAEEEMAEEEMAEEKMAQAEVMGKCNGL